MGTFRRIAVGSAAVAAGSVVAARAAERRWRAADDPSGADPTLLPAGEETKVETSDGAVLAATVAGEGPPVLLAHCWLGHRGFWGGVARRLVESGHQVVLYDQRGHGLSTIGDDGFAIDRLGADVHDVLEHFDLRDVAVAGHSMGGMAAQAFAIGHADVARDRVRSFTLVATAAHGLRAPRGVERGDAVLANPALERILARRAGMVFVRAAVGRRPRHADLGAIRDGLVRTPAAVRVGCLGEMRRLDLRAGLASITQPTRVVVGSRDTLTPRRLAYAMADAIPNADLVEIRGAGHMLPFEEPDAVAAAIAERT